MFGSATELLFAPYDEYVYNRLAGTLGNPPGWDVSGAVGPPGTITDGPLYPSVGLSKTWGCATGRVYKIDLADGSILNEGGDWPVTFDGSVGGYLGWFKSKLSWGTTAGEMWMVTATGNDTTPGNDGNTALTPGFPFRAPGRKIVSRGVSVVGGSLRVQFATDWGETYEFVIP